MGIYATTTTAVNILQFLQVFVKCQNILKIRYIKKNEQRVGLIMSQNNKDVKGKINAKSARP